MTVNIKKVIWFILFFVFLAGTILAVLLGIKYREEKDKNAQLYTQTQVEAKYHEYVEQIKSKNTTIEELNDKLTICVSQFETEKAEKERYQSQLNAKENEIANLNETIARLTATNNENELKIAQLEEEKQTLIEEKEDIQNSLNSCQATLVEKENEIANLNSTKTDLENQIVELNAKLDAYKDQILTDIYAIRFMNGQQLYNMVYIKQGSKLASVPTIENTEEMWFYGWSLAENDETIVDFNSYTPTADTTFYAVTGECARVRMTNLNSVKANTDARFYYYGKKLKIKDVLIFDDKLDFSDSNLEVVLESSGYNTDGNQVNKSNLTLDSKIEDLAYVKIQNASYINSETQQEELRPLYGFYLKYSLRYTSTKQSKIHLDNAFNDLDEYVASPTASMSLCEYEVNNTKGYASLTISYTGPTGLKSSADFSDSSFNTGYDEKYNQIVSLESLNIPFELHISKNEYGKIECLIYATRTITDDEDFLISFDKVSIYLNSLYCRELSALKVPLQYYI